jgi:UDP:flavonoid glycosyltransferase YjiC (YdhE family)
MRSPPAVRRVLTEPSFRQGAERLGESIRRDAASGALLAELEDLPAVAEAGR